MKKLGIIVPYRNRADHLEVFKKEIIRYLKNDDIEFKVIIVEQDNAKLFNRGMLLNIGFKYAEKLKCDYVVFHDVDMLPVNVDYSYSSKPLHLATEFVPNPNIERIIFDTYFGGVTLFPMESFKKINGYSNKYWGWGYEDDDLLHRCKKNGILLKEIKIKNQSDFANCLKFNGKDAFVKCRNNIDFNTNKTIFVSFFPDELICDHTKPVDNYTVFSIPGYDFSISYNSFSRYNFCCFDDKDNALYVNSNIKTNYRTTMCVTIDVINKKISVFQDGSFIGSVIMENPFREYSKEEFFYLGVGNPNRIGDPNFFKGYIDKFIVFNDLLNENEIKELPDNKSDRDVNLYYDAEYIRSYKLTDLSANGNDGKIIKCEMKSLKPDEYKIVKAPYRRDSLFKLLPHEDNGYLNNRWKTDFTRWNQLRFMNEVSYNDELLLNDGLSDLKFTEHGKYIDENIIRVIVGV